MTKGSEIRRLYCYLRNSQAFTVRSVFTISIKRIGIAFMALSVYFRAMSSKMMSGNDVWCSSFRYVTAMLRNMLKTEQPISRDGNKRPKNRRE